MENRPEIKKINTFEIVKYLGEGSEGQVMLAKDTKTGELVALKRMLLEPEINELSDLDIEMEILNICAHKNVIQFKKSFLVVGELFMIFEYMDYDLSTINSRLRLNPLQIKIVMRQVLEGLAHCHANHVVHLDIKPANILINDNGVAKVADFGLSSKISDPLPDPHYVGTLDYMAPELLLGLTTYGLAVDIWSLGCVFAEMLDGKFLFNACDYHTSESKCNCDRERQVFQQMIELCGTPKEKNWPGVTKLHEFERMMETLTPTCKKRTLKKRFAHVEDASAVSLLDRMLVMNPAKRITAEEALKVEYFTGPKPRGKVTNMVASSARQDIQCY